MSEDYFATPASRKGIEDKAAAWRQALRVAPDCYTPNISQILEIELPTVFPSFALVVGLHDQDDIVEAYTSFDPPKIVVREDIYLDCVAHKPRARFTLAHELGHLVLHKNAMPLHRAPEQYVRADKILPFASVEWQANAFAAAFLMPAQLVREFDNPADISEFFQVSHGAAVTRMKTLGIQKARFIPDDVRNDIENLTK
ncbi:MAG: ImmA/IrrE family metallo-endopeptidase [Pseudomonadota bacterium]